MGRPAATKLTGHAGVVLAVAFRADGKQLVAGGVDRSVRAWKF